MRNLVAHHGQELGLRLRRSAQLGDVQGDTHNARRLARDVGKDGPVALPYSQSALRAGQLDLFLELGPLLVGQYRTVGRIDTLGHLRGADVEHRLAGEVLVRAAERRRIGLVVAHEVQAGVLVVQGHRYRLDELGKEKSLLSGRFIGLLQFGDIGDDQDARPHPAGGVQLRCKGGASPTALPAP